MPSEELLFQVIIISVVLASTFTVFLTVITFPIMEFFLSGIKEYFYRLRTNWTKKERLVEITSREIEFYAIDPQTGVILLREVQDLSKADLPEPHEMSEK